MSQNANSQTKFLQLNEREGEQEEHRTPALVVVQGNETTLPVTMDEVIYHSRMVARARRRALIVADMP